MLKVSRPFVLLAGAGVSAAPPACLPGWWELNDAILAALFGRLTPLDIISDRAGEQILRRLADLRGDQRFPPDYQADFLEEEAGLDYFRGLAVVDHEQPNPFHCFVAELALRGEVTAIVTTNFDQMFERALEHRGVAHTIAFDQKSFATMAESIDQPSSSLCVLKVHGTAKHPESMIDTRKQRRRGRSRALMDCMRELLARHPLVVAGFSGDDLDTDQEYLGIRAAREASPGLAWIAHPPRNGAPPLKQGASSLREHYGADQFQLVVADATAAFAGLVGEQPPALPPVGDQHAVARTRLRSALAAWEATLDLPIVTCMAAALCEAAGMRPEAHSIVRTAWNRGVDREAGLPTRSVTRLLRAHARVRLRRGRYDDPELGATIHSLAALNDPTADVLNLFCQAMRRVPEQDVSDVQRLLPGLELNDGVEASDRADAGLWIAYTGTVTDLDLACIPLLENARQVARDDGDDVREALCAIELSLRLTKAGIEPERSAELAAFADRISSSIRDMRLASSVQLRHAFALAGSGKPSDAEQHMIDAFRLAASDESRLHMARSALYWLRLAARENLHFARAKQQLDQHLNADDLGPLASWAWLACAERAVKEQQPNAPALLAKASQLAASSGLEWYAREVERIAIV